MAGTLSDHLYRLAVKPGDAICVPTGTLHALLEGIVVAEIQQNSDTTYRVYDWGRLGADGKPRPLHIDKALDVIQYDMVRPQTYRPTVVEEGEGIYRAEISRCRYFVVEEVKLDGRASYRGRLDGATFEIWGCVSGECRVQWSGDPTSLRAVQFVLLPAALGDFAIQATRAATLLRAYAPE
jgi:mannose-6-phosphate isomerase